MKPVLKRKRDQLEANQMLAKLNPNKRVKEEDIEQDFAIRLNGKLMTKAMLEERKKELEKRLQKITDNKDAKIDNLKENFERYLEIPNSKFRLKWFDPKMINLKKEGQRVGIFGMTGSGKSVVAQQIMLANRYIPYSIIQCSSDPVNHQYSKLLTNDLTVYDEFDEDGLKRVKQRQERFCKEHEIPDTDPIQYDADPSVLVLLDDLSQFQKEINNSHLLNYYFNISRHHKVLFIDLKQYYAQMKPAWRRQLSWVIIMKPNSPKDIKSMWSEFFGMFTLKEYTHIINTATVNHGCLVLNALSDSHNLEDRVFFYRAPYPCPKFIMGTQWSRKLQKFYYQHGWDVQGETLLAEEEKILQNMDKERALLELADELKENEKMLNNLEKERAAKEKHASKRMRDIVIEGHDAPQSTDSKKKEDSPAKNTRSQTATKTQTDTKTQTAMKSQNESNKRIKTTHHKEEEEDEGEEPVTKTPRTRRLPRDSLLLRKKKRV